jgi:hypothetical protein
LSKNKSWKIDKIIEETKWFSLTQD